MSEATLKPDGGLKYMIEAENLVKIYKTDETEVLALQGLDLTVEPGELMAIIGNSGSGKSTLLNMIGCLDKPSAGKLFINGENVLKYDEKQLVRFKRETVGFVWQNNARNLIPYLSAKQNIEMPMFLTGGLRKERSKELLDIIGLSNRANNKLTELSGGEQQRVAIAIALANDPVLLLADEPTGSVDSRTAKSILDIFRRAKEQLGVTVVIVTHDRQLSKQVNRVVEIRDGKTSSEYVMNSNYKAEFSEIMNEEAAKDDLSEHVIGHEQLVVMDKVGRLQIPKNYLDDLGIDGRTKLRVDREGDSIIIKRV